MHKKYILFNILAISILCHAVPSQAQQPIAPASTLPTAPVTSSSPASIIQERINKQKAWQDRWKAMTPEERKAQKEKQRLSLEAARATQPKGNKVAPASNLASRKEASEKRKAHYAAKKEARKQAPATAP